MPDDPTLTATLEPHLPPMAWLVTIDGAHATVHHGFRVETWATGFFEGAYAGRWLDDDPSLATDVFGSGMVIRDGAFHLVTPSHSLEALFIGHHDGVIAASNSLAFLVERLGIEVPVDYQYGARFASLILGKDKHERKVIRNPLGNIHRLVHDNVRIDTRQRQMRVPKPPCDPFDDYRQYVRHAHRVLESIIGNARDGRRSFTYSPTSTISSGYDSTAVTALGTALGVTRAVTLVNARGGGDDSGERIGHHLGVHVERFCRRDANDANLDSAAEYVATGMGGEDFCYRDFVPTMTGSILLTGFQAVIWDPAFPPTAPLIRGDCSGASLQESRLRLGFIHLPAATIGITAHESMHHITLSAEMQPYHLGTELDRPIARRILQEVGVPGDLFGQVKKATSTLFFEGGTLREQLRFRNHRFTAATRSDVIEHASRLGADPRGSRYWMVVLRWVLAGKVLWYGMRARSALRKLRDRSPSPIDALMHAFAGAPLVRRLDNRFEHARLLHKFNPPATSLLFLVGLDLVRARYRQSGREGR